MKRLSFWLVPSQEYKTSLKKAIETLNKNYNTSYFEPHVTIYSGYFFGCQSPEILIEKIIHMTNPIALEVNKISYSKNFNKTLFVQLQKTMLLENMSMILNDFSIDKSGYHLDPHLSLIYKNISVNEKKRLAALMDIPRTLLFDEVAVVATPYSFETQADVEALKILCVKSLCMQ